MWVRRCQSLLLLAATLAIDSDVRVSIKTPCDRCEVALPFAPVVDVAVYGSGPCADRIKRLAPGAQRRSVPRRPF